MEWLGRSPSTGYYGPIVILSGMHVVVVGGGIVGFSSAYRLADRGVDVTVCEKTGIGAGSTDRAAGGIRAQFSTPVSIELSKRSIDVWERFEEDFGVDIGYTRPGYLYLARESATADLFKDNIRIHHVHDVPSQFLDPNELPDVLPAVAPDRYVGASYCPTDGYADPHLGLQGFYTAAREAGVEVRVGTAVTDVTGDERVTGVQTTDGHIEADAVVNAAGAWAPQVAAMAGVDLPVRPVRRQAMVVAPETPVPETVPFTTDIDSGSYFRPDGGGDALVGGHFAADDPDVDPDGLRDAVEMEWTARALDEAGEIASYFGEATKLKEGWAGLYALTPDHHPVIEETIPGFVSATGFSGHGFMQSPATGMVVSEIVVDGEASTVDVSMLTADRFERGEPLHETFYSA